MAERHPPPMSYYAKVTLTVVAILALLAAAWSVRHILVLLLVAAVLAVGLDPPVRRLERLRIPRGWAVLIIFLLAVGFIVLFAFLVIPPIVREVQGLARDIPRYITRLERGHATGFVADLERKYHLSQRLKEATSRIPSLASASFGTILGITASIAGMIFNLLTVGILTIYFLMALPRGEETARTLVAGENTQRNIRILDESLQRVGGYVSGNIFVSIIAGVTAFVAMWLIGVPFAAALAMWVAITDLIPAVGATLGAVVCVVVALFSSIGAGIATAAYFLVYQQFENYVIQPRVMTRAVDLSAATVIISVLVGGSLAGLAGGLLALPLAAAIKVAIRELWLRGQLREPTASEVAGAPPTTPPRAPGRIDLPPPSG
jgi:predicted PurR-regulated permease PerM